MSTISKNFSSIWTVADISFFQRILKTYVCMYIYINYMFLKSTNHSLLMVKGNTLIFAAIQGHHWFWSTSVENFFTINVYIC